MNTEILLPKGFRWTIETCDSAGRTLERETQHNLIPNDGLTFLMRAPFGDVQSVSDFYLGLFKGNYIPTPSVKAGDINTLLNELTEYEEGGRPQWQRAMNGVATMDNFDNKAEFTLTADRTLYGAFLVSNPGKESTSGLMLSCVRFTEPKILTAGQVVKLSGGITFESAGF